MNRNRSFPWFGAVLAVGCGCMLCVGLVGAGGVAYYYMQRPSPPVSPQVINTVPPPPVEHAVPTDAPVIPGATSVLNPEPADSGPSLTGNQKLDFQYFFDDFSSDALDWPVYEDGKTIMKYEDGQYSIQITESDFYDWAFLPVDFNPLEIWFDVKGMDGPQNGTFGVFCQFQDEDNYYYVEFDLGEASYVIGQYVDDKDIPLTQQNDVGQYWQEASGFNSSPAAVNRIGVSCYQSVIAIFINDEWLTEAAVQEPAADQGQAAFFVYTYPFAEAAGYKVYFDNVEVYEPVQ